MNFILIKSADLFRSFHSSQRSNGTDQLIGTALIRHPERFSRPGLISCDRATVVVFLFPEPGLFTNARELEEQFTDCDKNGIGLELCTAPLSDLVV